MYVTRDSYNISMTTQSVNDIVWQASSNTPHLEIYSYTVYYN